MSLPQRGKPRGRRVPRGKDASAPKINDRRLVATPGSGYRVLQPGAGLEVEVDGVQGGGCGREGLALPVTDHRARCLHELYTFAHPGCTARVTVPTLWDAKTRRVVNNESAEIIRMFNSAFAAIAPATPDYYPAHLRAAIDATNALVFKCVNDATNGCG